MAEVEYKCLRCGSLESFINTQTGISCKSCGFRIFVKPRRQGHKTLDAI
ncbi:MAG: DNA-directed RNA polymerase subunit P [Candidatus Thermoplasmatota archaeon]|nr:DNA-directed RNA polymerase subunit P [Candidatus Thermoplasmatota archaeon]